MNASPTNKRLSRLVGFALLLALTACGSGYDGRYASIGRDGEIQKNSEGQPRVILTVDGDSAALAIMGDTELFQARILDDKLHLVPLNGAESAVVLRKEGNQLVTEGGGRENRMVRL